MTKITNKKAVSFSDCPCIGATLDKLLQPALLAILAKRPSYGYDLAKQIGDIPNFLDHSPDVSGVYRLLKTLESRGMVVAEWDISESSRAKRLYSITDDGRRCLELWCHTLQNYKLAVGSLLKTAQKALGDFA